jgi:hypothetical protein
MAVIGVIDIMMKASTEPFVKGVKDAGSALGGFLQKASAATGLDSLTGKLASAGPALKGFASDLASSIGQVAKMGAVAGGVALGGLAAFVASSLDTVDAQGEMAERLGVTGGAMSAFGYAVKLTGGPVEALPEILGKLNGTLGLAAREATPAAAAIRRLGLDAKALADSGPIEATKAIADRLSKIESTAERAAVATQIFGEQGAKLAGTFKAGAGGIASLEAEAQKLGIVLTEGEHAAAAAAKDAMDRAGTAIQGIGSQLAVQLAPYIEAAASQFAELGSAGGGAGPMIATGLDMAGTAVGFVADAANYLKLTFLNVQSFITSGFAGVVSIIASVGEAIESVVNMLPGVEVSFTQTVRAIADDLDKLAGQQVRGLQDALDQDPPSTKIKSFLDGIKDSANKSAEAINSTASATRGLGDSMADSAFKVSELESKLKEQIATVGMTSSQIEVYKLAQKGASTADVERVAGLANQLKELEANHKAQEKFASDATKLFEDTRTPLEKFKLEASKIQAMFDQGFIDKETLARGLDKAKKDAGAGGESKRAGAIEFGSKEARSAILTHQGRADSSDQAVKTATIKGAEANAKSANTLDQFLTIVRQRIATANTDSGSLLGI